MSEREPPGAGEIEARIAEIDAETAAAQAALADAEARWVAARAAQRARDAERLRLLRALAALHGFRGSDRIARAEERLPQPKPPVR